MSKRRNFGRTILNAPPSIRRLGSRLFRTIKRKIKFIALFVVVAIAGYAVSATLSSAQVVEEPPEPLAPLSSTPPGPSNLATFVRNRNAATVLGKAFF